jgi:hypothetical protein
MTGARVLRFNTKNLYASLIFPDADGCLKLHSGDLCRKNVMGNRQKVSVDAPQNLFSISMSYPMINQFVIDWG